MSSIIRNRALALAVLASSLIFSACSKDNPEEPEPTTPVVTHSSDYYASLFLRDEYMAVYYYWADQVREANKSINLDSYTTSQAFDKMLYSKDRWSWMTDADSYLSSSTGTYKGTWGVSFSQAVDYYNDYGLYVKYILPGSPFEKHGVTRGAKLWAVDGILLGDQIDSQAKVDAINNNLMKSPNTFIFKLTNGEEVKFTESLATTLQTDYVLCYKVFTEEDFPGLPCPVGYIHYLSYESVSISAMDGAMSEFQKAGVKKVIVDLRYNGGGDSDVCQRLISYLAPAGLQGEPYLKRQHNSALKNLNKSSYLGLLNEKTGTYSDMSIGADEIYFILQNQSASSSEVTYNGLRPYLKEKVHHVGLQSYGKPNGMYVLFYPGEDSDYEKYTTGDYSLLKYVFLPICFYNTNSAGEEIPSTSEEYSGFVPENERPDDIFNDFGVDESDIFACLTHIATGEYPEIDQTHVRKQSKSRPGIIVESMTTEAQTAGNYGTFYEFPINKIK